MRRLRVSLILIVCLGAAVAAHQPLRGIVLAAFRLPLVLVQSGVNIVVRLPQLPRLAEENDALRRDLAARHVELAQLTETLRRLLRVQDLKHVFPEQSPRVVSIIGRTTAPTEHMVIIDQGANDGIRPNAILLDARGIIGRVVEVQPTTSSGMLLTDPDSRVACLIERSRELGLLEGRGGSVCRLVHLDLEADVADGDRVVTAGLGGPFPKGLLVGTVTRVVRNEQDATAAAWVRPAVKLSQVEELLCFPPSS